MSTPLKGLQAVVGRLRFVPKSLSIIARLMAASRLSSTTRMRRRSLAVADARSGSACDLRRRVKDQRQPDDELASHAVAVAAGLDAAAVHLDQALDEREADAQAALRFLERSINLRKHVEDAAAACGPGCPRR